MKYYNYKARQAGMTLIELTVVLLIMIGLAGLLIPYVGGFVAKTHDSVNTDELAAVNGAIQRYDVQFLGYPDGLDSLVADSTTNIYSKMMRSANFSAVQLSATELAALNDIGINSVYNMDNATTSATFAATTGGSITLVTSSYVARIANIGMMSNAGFSDLQCKVLFNGKPCDTANKKYIAFGVGSDNAMIGRTISEAPVHFAKSGNMNAANRYNRIVAVFEVPSASGSKAKFMGTIMPMMNLIGIGGALDSAYTDMSN